jgi:phosphoribosylamine---glycine ligase
MTSKKNVLVIGSGGREHAIIKYFRRSPDLNRIWVLPGNDGMVADAELASGSWQDTNAVVQFCQDNQIDLVFIGPEDPLVFGLCDVLRERGIACIGPDKRAAQLEGSKVFAKEFMHRAGVPTADAQIVRSVTECLAAAAKFTPPYVLKADGLAAGKGVFVCPSISELEQSSISIFHEKKLGSAGLTALLEDHIAGWELSYLVLTNGETFEALPLAQDHKRLFDDNKGPNTGGMGTVAPLALPVGLNEKIVERIVKPTIQQIKTEGFTYRGVLFIGVMIRNNEPFVLEYNTRFGDPETQAILPLLKNDAVDLFLNLARGHLQDVMTTTDYCACIVNAAAGYPEQPQRGTPIDVSQDILPSVLFAGVKLENEILTTNGGRVLNVVALGRTAKEAINRAYTTNEKIRFQGRQFRTDIGRYLPGPAKT